MVYTELKQKNEKKYYYRVRSMRNGKKFKKERVYLGVNLTKEELLLKEREADESLIIVKKTEGKNENLEKIKPKIINILRKNKIKKAGIFGSYVKGEQKKDSDIDILIEFNRSLLDLIAIERELKIALKKKVDLLTYGCINPLLKERILGEEVRII